MDNGRCRVQGAIKHIKYSEGANAAPGASEKEKHNNISETELVRLKLHNTAEMLGISISGISVYDCSG